LTKRKGFEPIRTSDIFAHDSRLATHDESRIFLLDSIGRLKDFYSIADIVFIGGSLIKHGGQNPIEPAYFSKPVIFGPFMFNFDSISQILLKEGAGIQVKGKAELEAAVANLITDPKKCRAMGVFAKRQ